MAFCLRPGRHAASRGSGAAWPGVAPRALLLEAESYREGLETFPLWALRGSHTGRSAGRSPRFPPPPTKTIKGKLKWLTNIAEALNVGKAGTSVFRNYGINREKGLLSRWWQRGFGLQKNIQLSKQLAATKFWSRFLDSLGIANFVGPDKFESIYGPEMTQEALETYASTPEGQSLYKQEIAKLMGQQTQIPQSPSISGTEGGISQSPITSALLKLMSPI